MQARNGMYFAGDRGIRIAACLAFFAATLFWLGTVFGQSRLESTGAAFTRVAGPPESSAAGTYRGHAPAADAAQRVFKLRLNADGSFTLTTVYVGKGKVVERGSWRQNTDEIMLTFQPLGSGHPPNPITFRYRHDALHPKEWDHSEWGHAGPPVFSRTKTDEPAQDS